MCLHQCEDKFCTRLLVFYCIHLFISVLFCFISPCFILLKTFYHDDHLPEIALEHVELLLGRSLPIIRMASKLHCLRSLFLGRSGRNLLSTRLLHTSKIKCAPKQYSHAKEDVIAYSKFRKELSESRFQFQKELRAHQEMSMEEFNAQAAEEGRLEREAEDKVLETNRVELERMARKR